MTTHNNNGANLGFERELWQAADALRSNMDAVEYKHVVLGLIFIKCISDAFEEQHSRLKAEGVQVADLGDVGKIGDICVFGYLYRFNAQNNEPIAPSDQTRIG